MLKKQISMDDQDIVNVILHFRENNSYEYDFDQQETIEIIMDGLAVYETYMAVRAAFTSDYDYFKYNGKIKITKENFLAHKNKWQFVGLGRNFGEKTSSLSAEDFPYFLALTFMTKGIDDSWITNISKDFDNLRINFNNWKQWNSASEVNFERELQAIKDIYNINTMDDFKNIFGCFPFKTQPLFNMYIASSDFPHLIDRINATLSAILMLDYYLDLTKNWNNVMVGNYVWDDFYSKYSKYKKFFYAYRTWNDTTVKNIIKTTFTFTN